MKGSLLEVGIEIGRKTGGGTRTGRETGTGTRRETGAEKRTGEAEIEIETGIEMGNGKGIVTIRIEIVIERGNEVRGGNVEEAEMTMMIITEAEIMIGNRILMLFLTFVCLRVCVCVYLTVHDI